jgi:toxin ParE1/3/4
VKALRFHRQAREEVRAEAQHYASIHLDLGRQFVDAIEQLVRQIQTQPTLFRMFEPPARRHFGPRFPYAVVYVDLPDHVWIVAVMHC